MKINLSITLITIILFSVLFTGCEKATDSLISPTEKYEIDLTACKSCAKCYDICPHDAIDYDGGKPVIIQSKCKQCGKCADICPEDAIN